MKRFLLLLLLTGALIGTASHAHAQIFILELIKKAAKKAIKAIDLQVQRLQNRTIELQNIQKKLENTLSKLRLDQIGQWTQKQKELYSKYYDELMRVKTVIAYYQKVKAIADRQKELVTEYQRVFSLLRTDRHFTPEEIQYIYTVYSNIIDRSIVAVGQILDVIQSFRLKMSDADRLALIDQYATEVETYISDLRRFSDRNISISLSRAADQKEYTQLLQLYGRQN